MTELSAIELFCIVLSGLVFFIVFNVIQTNWNHKYNENGFSERKNSASRERVFLSRLVVLRRDEREEVLAGKMETGPAISEAPHIVMKTVKEESLLVRKYP